MKFRFLTALIIISPLANCASMQQDCSLISSNSSDMWRCFADQGSKEHQFRVGMEYFVVGDYQTARNWLSKSAGDDARIVTKDMGLSISGSERPFNSTSTEIIDDGNEAANFMMARLYAEGLGVGVDLERAAEHKRMTGNKVVEIAERDSRFTVSVHTPSSIHADLRLFELYSFDIVPAN